MLGLFCKFFLLLYFLASRLPKLSGGIDTRTKVVYLQCGNYFDHFIGDCEFGGSLGAFKRFATGLLVLVITEQHTHTGLYLIFLLSHNLREDFFEFVRNLLECRMV